jgi:light-regulated signal transduction histidine kinase (bacteriophytochrome)
MKEYSEALIRKLEEKNTELEQAQEEIKKANQDLERRVRERTAELLDANVELEAFSRSVAHDLRNPLAVILGFASLLESTCGHKLDEAEAKYLRKIAESSSRMEALIVDLLKLSQGTRAEIHAGPVDVSALVEEILHKLQEASAKRTVEAVVAPDVVAKADAQLLQIALENLLGNAWKFTGREERARIEFGLQRNGSEQVYFVRDNGVGFDMAGAEKLFGTFQRFHSSAEFPGTGIGLTTVHRIIRRHGGRIWAESAPEQGTTFYFTL